MSSFAKYVLNFLFENKILTYTQCVNGSMNELIRVYVSLNTAHTFSLIQYQVICMYTSTFHILQILHK